MRQYVLLRENRKSGPYCLEKLSKLDLYPNDLIWIENESTRWLWAGEIEELAPFIDDSVKSDFHHITYVGEQVEIRKNLVQDLNVLKEKYHSHQNRLKIRSKRKAQQLKLSVLAYVVACLWLIGFFVFEIVNKLNPGFYITKRLVKVPISLSEGSVSEKKPDPEYQNAINRDFVIVDTTFTSMPEKMELFDWRKQVRIFVQNIRHKGLEHLKESQIVVIENKSSHLINYAIIEVQYVQSDGKVLGIEEIMVSSIGAMSKRTLQLPPKKEGIKVKHRILDVRAKDYYARHFEA